MRILLSTLPKSGWWHSGIPKYPDNPAMQEGAIPNHAVVEQERTSLIDIIKNEGHDVFEIPFPKSLDHKTLKHDFVFVRDQFITDQKGKAIILRASELSRRVENFEMYQLLKNMDLDIHHIPDKPGVHAEGGEFYYCAKDNVLFSGIQRNSQAGIDAVAELMNVDELVILDGSGYHLDTFFTPVLATNGSLCAIIICKSILTNQSKHDLEKFANKSNIPIFDIPIQDAIGTVNNIGSFAANALPLPGVLIGPNHFTDRTIDNQLAELGVKRIITSTSQFELSGGSVHCITNEI